MITTTLKNSTNSVVVLREGQVGVLRKVCEIQPGGSHQVRSNLTATYKEYWCAVQPGSEKFILTSDDCIDWKEIEIRPKEGDSTGKYEWKGTVAATNKASANQGHSSSPDGPPAAASSFLAKLVPKKVLSWLFKPKSPDPGADLESD